MKVALGVSGGIACYKSAEILRRLQDRGVDVTVLMTKGATQFVEVGQVVLLYLPLQALRTIGQALVAAINRFQTLAGIPRTGPVRAGQCGERHPVAKPGGSASNHATETINLHGTKEMIAVVASKR